MPASLPPVSIFGRRLRAARRVAGLSQVELGALLGMNEKAASSRLSRYERGEREPDHETLAALSEALGVPPAYFHASSDVLAEVILLVARLPAERQKGVLDLLRNHLASPPA
ncbi:helix-turn-helix transcriptional regulator [Xanthomonas translucens pv. undulosa]|uniref:helix-turn-helix domain-containing protein n=1 Tax=Xanthomonas campestris pv. translucens TaxID=343 RepID=UPI0019D6F815|nr:helix-turn-helix transcriptional regulator [Xanthomonas translucens]QSQ54327.1 helix-turn-helix transcriptional regulator [Xanthomonas translucens pv. undulosa]QSQ60053.1 helix-turn-helix transcriptional regulator [Xanthomonas translucens pv. undulosa]